MGLSAEPVKKKKKTVPVGKYVPDEDRDWLQDNRIELKAMQFGIVSHHVGQDGLLKAGRYQRKECTRDCRARRASQTKTGNISNPFG